jgi:hypothetical protein
VDAVRRLVPVIAAALACAACAVPVFDPAVSASVATIRASHVVGTSDSTIGPDMDSNGKPDWDLERDAITFMPERWAGSITPEKGFVIRNREWDNWNEIWYQWWDGSTVKWMGSPAGYNEEEGLRWRWPVTPKNGSSLGAIIFDGGDFETYIDRLHADTGLETCTWEPVYHSYNLAADIKADIGLIIVPTPIVVGMSVNALDLPGQDRLHVLVRENSSYSEAEVLFNDLGIMGSFTDSISPHAYPLPFLATPRHVNYARDTGRTRSFAQWLEDNAWRTWAWKGSGVQPPIDIDEAVGIDHRIDAVLTPDAGWDFGSYLLSTEKQIARIYYYNGPGTESQVAEFGLGTLRFIGEMYLNGEWQLLFSRALINDQSETPSMRFEIRGIYTRDLLNAFGL